MSITKKDVDYVAKLSRIKITDKEAEDFASELDDILAYMEKLNQLDTKNEKPTSHILDITNVTREDRLNNESLTNDEALKMAPEKEEKFFKVPKVIE